MMGKGITIEDMEDELRSIDLRHPGEVVGAEDSVQSAEMSLVRSKQQNKAPSTSRTAAFEDIGDYVNVQRHESILSAIEQSLSSSARDFDRSHRQRRSSSSDCILPCRLRCTLAVTEALVALAAR